MNETDETTAKGSPGLLEELRRRKVVRVGLACVMASWALLQVVTTRACIVKKRSRPLTLEPFVTRLDF